MSLSKWIKMDQNVSMDMSKDQMEQQLLKLSEQADENNVACKICWLPFTHGKRIPITLMCGHTICRMCIGILVKGLKHVPCGVCRERTFIDPKRLAKNVELTKMLTHFGFLIDDLEEDLINLDENSSKPSYSDEGVYSTLLDYSVTSKGDSTPKYAENEGYSAHFASTGDRHSANSSHQESNIMGRVEQIIHSLHEAIESIRDQGDLLQIYMVEDQSNVSMGPPIQARIQSVFNELQQMIDHPVHDEIENLYVRHEKSSYENTEAIFRSTRASDPTSTDFEVFENGYFAGPSSNSPYGEWVSSKSYGLQPYPKETNILKSCLQPNVPTAAIKKLPTVNFRNGTLPIIEAKPRSPVHYQPQRMPFKTWENSSNNAFRMMSVGPSLQPSVFAPRSASVFAPRSEIRPPRLRFGDPNKFRHIQGASNWRSPI